MFQDRRKKRGLRLMEVCRGMKQSEALGVILAVPDLACLSWLVKVEEARYLLLAGGLVIDFIQACVDLELRCRKLRRHLVAREEACQVLHRHSKLSGVFQRKNRNEVPCKLG
ncbi:hypothetical protein AVEN_119094-1 [Araneus ventricosus]|uniref:Uncharacterized protein n=1 Tax=Araneus ventricosus TaxID=182803 RepID=A0A4Y2BM67_ARAVE|nr:hypothetical protein AVEN_119094-1 [Araneus ventricosus]